jgi:predicted protein tyrosine phosphatase
MGEDAEMIQVNPHLFVGTEQDYELRVKNKPGWAVVHACKEPYHRRLLGYTGRGAPKEHPEYLMARRGNRLFLNLVDTEDSAYVSSVIIRATIDFIGESLAADLDCLVHCNLGESRSPSLGLLYLVSARAIPNASLLEAEVAFMKLYPTYKPKAGIRGFLATHWAEYAGV